MKKILTLTLLTATIAAFGTVTKAQPAHTAPISVGQPIITCGLPCSGMPPMQVIQAPTVPQAVVPSAVASPIIGAVNTGVYPRHDPRADQRGAATHWQRGE